MSACGCIYKGERLEHVRYWMMLASETPQSNEPRFGNLSGVVASTPASDPMQHRQSLPGGCQFFSTSSSVPLRASGDQFQACVGWDCQDV